MARPHNVVRIGGNLPGGEVWSVTPKFIGNFGDPIVGYEDLLEWATSIALLNGGSVLPNGLRSLLSTAASVTTIRTEYRDANNDLAQAAEFVLPTPAAGTGSATKPFQTSIVTSLLTGRPGRSYRGRLYWPALSATISTSTLRLAEATATSIASAAATFLTEVQSSVPEGADVVLAVVSDKLGTGAAVNSIQVGDILDTQRRRRDSLLEGRVSANFPAAP